MSQPITLQSALTPELLKAVLSNSLLKEIMTSALIIEEAPSDLNDITRSGIYFVNKRQTNTPINGLYGFVFVGIYQSMNFNLFLTPYNGVGATAMPRIFGRMKWASDGITWGRWYLLATAQPLPE